MLREPLTLLWRKRSLLLSTTASDIRARYAGSLLGLVWIVIYPLLLLGAYAAVYIYIYKVKFRFFDSNEYVAVIFSGLIPFLAFAEALGAGVPAVTGNTGLIKNTMYPIELVPAKAVLIGQPTQVVGMVLLAVAAGIMGKLSVWTLLVPGIWLMQLLFTMGVVWILSSLNVYIRDLQNIVSVIVLILMMVSPIAYPKEEIPAGLQPLLAINPLYYIIVAYQDSLVLARCSEGWVLATLAGMSLATFFIGYWFFGRLKRTFADNV